MRKTIRRLPWYEGGQIVGMLMDGQRYRLVRVGFYQSTQTKNVIEVAYYSTECASCQEPLEVFVKVDAEEFSPARRCSACAKPGVKAANEPSPQSAGPAADSIIWAGQRIRHPHFGVGVVRQTENVPGRGLALEADFESLGRRKVIAAYCTREPNPEAI